MFLPDGIIDEAAYSEASVKILFIAKEANWHPADDGTIACEQDAPYSSFWHQDVAFGRTAETMFSQRLSMLANAITTNEYSKTNKSHDVLKSVAVINLNKRGGSSYCNEACLSEYVKKYQAYIREQIELVNPHLIVCCGYAVKWLADEYSLADGIKTITIYHPSYFAITDLDYLQQLKCAMCGETWHSSIRSDVDRKDKCAPIKGIIIDTNKTYSDVSTMDMLLNNKLSAYDDAGRIVDSFNIGDYVFFSIKGVGIVAGGRVLSDIAAIRYDDGIEKFRTVEFISPTLENMPHQEENLRSISWSAIQRSLNHGFFHARTDKRPYLSEIECNILLDELKKLYSD